MPSSSMVFLMYHELEIPGRSLCQTGPDYVRYVITEADFRSQMSWLQHSGWQGINVSQGLGFHSEKSVVITFDDGCETDFLAAAPVLRENNCQATFYVTAGFLGQNGYMTASQLRELSALGFEIGCHSMSHAYLNDLDAAGLKREMVEAKQRLEQLIGKNVEHFSCPGGRYDERALEVARAAGYLSLATSRPRSNSIDTDPFALGRVVVLRDTTLDNFQQICRGRGLRTSQLRNSLFGGAKHMLGNALYDRIRALLLGNKNP
jgi:peptidoglycan/xylan/chitin deacetylase (PgdA/CDA1 family)